MNNLLKAEIYKKRKYFYYVLIFGGLPMFYSLGIKMGWSFVVVTDKSIDLLSFCDAMWELLFILGIPLTYFLFFSSSILGGEIKNGQILLELPKVANRKSVVLSKICTVLILLVYFFVSEVLFSSVCYFINIRGTEFSSDAIILQKTDSHEVLLIIVFDLLYYIMMCLAALMISIRISTIATTLICMGVHVFIKLLSEIKIIALFVPGSIVLNNEMKMGIKETIVQLFLIILWMLLLLILTVIEFEKKDL